LSTTVTKLAKLTKFGVKSLFKMHTTTTLMHTAELMLPLITTAAQRRSRSARDDHV